MKQLFFLIILIIISANSFFAQTKSNSSLNSAPKIIQDQANGYSFALPKDWTQQEADGGYILLNAEKTASIVLKPHVYDTFEAFAAAEIDLQKEGLKTAGEIQDLGNGGKTFRVFKTVGDKSVILDTFFLRSEFKGGLVIVSLTNDNETAKKSFETANQLSRTVKFSAAQESPLDQQLKTAFSGKKLSFYYTGNGYSEQKIIWLCGSGSYASKTETSSVSGLGSGATAGSDQGVWSISSTGNVAYLILNSQKGNGQKKFAVTPRQASSEIGLNGAKYFIQTHTECD